METENKKICQRLVGLMNNITIREQQQVVLRHICHMELPLKAVEMQNTLQLTEQTRQKS